MYVVHIFVKPACPRANGFLQSTRVSFLGLGLKPRPRALSFFLSVRKPNTMPVSLGWAGSLPVSPEVLSEVSPKPMPPWVSALA